jgi:hypothetical protein
MSATFFFVTNYGKNGSFFRTGLCDGLQRWDFMVISHSAGTNSEQLFLYEKL